MSYQHGFYSCLRSTCHLSYLYRVLTWFTMSSLLTIVPAALSTAPGIRETMFSCMHAWVNELGERKKKGNRLNLIKRIFSGSRDTPKQLTWTVYPLSRDQKWCPCVKRLLTLTLRLTTSSLLSLKVPSCCCNCCGKGSPRECTLTHSLRTESIAAGTAWWQMGRQLVTLLSRRGSRNDGSWNSAHFLLFFRSEKPAHGIVPPTFRVGPPTSVKPT